VTLGTDGYGLYQSSARSEEAVMRSLGLSRADLQKITDSDNAYLAFMQEAERKHNLSR